ncbi:hypothetical protein BpHYR1_004541 [Brachionus plicatilis]|uniref:Uncharacterized protein n=1 Tax=Brachionus plicatilis TaxID=10195 RepID=A0A3M7PXH7_BRAPC|nr:hypothetical protein BpHYR1_004541 [Brachionus plicatilis]
MPFLFVDKRFLKIADNVIDFEEQIIVTGTFFLAADRKENFCTIDQKNQIKKKSPTHNFIISSFTKANDDSPSKIVLLVDHLNKASGVHKIQAILRRRYDASQLIPQTLDLLSQIKVLCRLGLPLELNAIVLSLTLLHALTQRRYVGIILKLVERPLQHKLGIDALDAQQIEHHVVSQVKGRVERIGLALDDVLGGRGRHALINHQNNNALVVEAPAARPARHLNVLAGRNPPGLFAVPFAARREQDCARRHVQAHGKGLGGEQHFEQAFREQYLNGLLEHRQHARVQRQHALHLGQLLVFVGQNADRVGEHLIDQLFFLVSVVVGLGGYDRVRLALLLTEAEHYHWRHLFVHYGLQDFVARGLVGRAGQVGAAAAATAAPSPL